MAIETHVVPRVLKVAVRSGTPTMDELRVYYPARFTWLQLKTFVNSGYVRFSTIVHPHRDAL
jgi:hypothetical protein